MAQNTPTQSDDITLAQFRQSVLSSAMESAKEALKSLLLLNGAAAVALLTFIGHLVAQKEYRFIGEFVLPMGAFVIGLAFVPLSHGLSYATNLFFARLDQRAKSFRVAAVATAVISLVCFVIGACLATSGFVLLSKASKPTGTAVIQEVK